LWNLNGSVVCDVFVIVEAPLFAPSPTYSASPMLKTNASPLPNFIGVLVDRVEITEPSETFLIHGSRISLGMLRSPVVKTAIAVPS